MSNKQEIKKGNLGIFGIFVVLLAILVGTTFNTIKNGLNLGLDLKGGFEILYEATPLNEGAEVDMTVVTNSISKRVNILGVNEPQILVEGDNRVRIQLAGVDDPDSARDMIGTTANLTFRDINDNELADSSILVEGGASLAYQDGKPIVSLQIKDQDKFGEITGNISSMADGQNIMIIWLDYEDGDSYQAELEKVAKGEEPKYVSAASVRTQITGNCIIEGNFTEAEARTMANLINSGSLPVKLTEISSNVVSAQYGADALHKTAIAGAIGILLVMAFMIFKYRMPGLVAAIMLVFYIWAVFGLYSLMGAVFTLSGIGALVLGVGMTVDANIISYERIRQELYKGRTVRAAVVEGQKVSFSAIFDAQLTTLLAAVIMYIWGNGAVKGFATMLIITVVMTLLLNVAVSRWLLRLLVNSGIADNKPEWFGVKANQIPDVSKGESQFYTGTNQFDYIGKAKLYIRVAIAIFALTLVIGLVNAFRGNGFFNLGIDFSAGSKLTIENSNSTTEEVDTVLAELGYSGFRYQIADDGTIFATTKTVLEKDDIDKVQDTFASKFGDDTVVTDNVVTPVVGKDLVRNAIILTIVAWIAMMIYVTIRYEWDYAVGCIVALVHDVMMTLALFGIVRSEVNTELISVLLTIIGYSINNSIVVFDRIRETISNYKGNISADKYKAIVNESLDSTIKMSLYSSLTTLLPMIMLLVMGSRSIFTFIFAMLVGLISGTLSSLFIAPSVWVYVRTHFNKNSKKKTKKHTKKEALDEYTIKGINA